MIRVALIYPDGTTTVGGVVCRLVPVDIVADAIVSLGAFVSDEGWSQGDMDNFDRLCAFRVDVSALPELPERETNLHLEAQILRGYQDGWNECLDAIAPGSAPTEG